MPWQNGPLMLYHGTDINSANNIMQHGINLTLSKALTDFGQGFYLTTYFDQAKNWANVRCRLIQTQTSAPTPPVATVLRLEIRREHSTTPTQPDVSAFV